MGNEIMRHAMAAAGSVHVDSPDHVIAESLAGLDVLYCRVDGERMQDFYSSRLITELNGAPGFTARVSIVEDQDGAWWCWRDASDGKVWFVWPDRQLLSMCFPCGIEAEEQRGRGRAFRARVEILDRYNGEKR